MSFHVHFILCFTYTLFFIFLHFLSNLFALHLFFSFKTVSEMIYAIRFFQRVYFFSLFLFLLYWLSSSHHILFMTFLQKFLESEKAKLAIPYSLDSLFDFPFFLSLFVKSPFSPSSSRSISP